MIIGFDAKRAFLNRSGLGNYSRSTIELLAKNFPKNLHVLYTTNTDDSLAFNTFDAKVVEPRQSFHRLLKSYWRTVYLAKRFKHDKLDVFHGLSNELPQNAHKTNTKNIVTIHDLIFLRYPELYKPIDRRIYRQKFKYASEIADTVIAISEQTKSDIVNFFGIDENKIEVVHQGCNPIFSKQVEISERIEITQKYKLPEKYILYVGTIEKRKNALSIVKAVHENNIDIPILLIGRRTEYQKSIEEYISKHQLHNKVIIQNNIPFVDFPAIYQQAEMFIYPSIFEGFGIPILEALNSEIPVITTRGGCFSEAGGQSSIYINPIDTNEMADAINKLLFDSNYKNYVTSAGLEYAQNFTEDKIAQNIMKVYLK